jgi:ADP-ribose pyrophosphatase YjhB (NUDIX family)
MDNRECKIHKLVADVLICVNGTILLVRYKEIKKHDDQGDWFLPNTDIKFGEHPSEAAMRILLEQFHNYMGNATLSYIESHGGRDVTPWRLLFHHKVELDHSPTITCSSEVRDYKWFAWSNLPPRLAIAHGGPAIDVIREILKPVWAGSIQQST